MYSFADHAENEFVYSCHVSLQDEFVYSLNVSLKNACQCVYALHTTNVESETMERSSTGEGGRRLGFLFRFVTIRVSKHKTRPFTK